MLGAVMLSTALVAIDSTIIATAVPSVVDDIGGFAQFPWLFSVYLLAQAVTVPLCGKLADLFGRKPVILFGIATFFVGSVLCGVATSMTMLIVFRVVQGLGAGAIAPMTVTIVGDLYTVEERAKVQGYVASVWGISSVVGPTLGGVFSEYVSWRWIFLVNIPLCLLAGAMIMKNYHERRTPARPVIDYRGAVLLTAGLTLVILGVLEGGQAWAWDSPASAATLGIGALLLGAFLLAERRTTEPVLPLWVFRRRLLVASGVVSAGAGAILLGLSSYVPTYAQEVIGVGPLVAGLALAALTIGWPIAASQSGRLYLRYGFRRCALAGASLIVLGSALLLLLGGGSSIWQVGATSLVIGLGMGLTVSPTLIASQSSVGWRERGVVTANNLFLRSVGSSLGTAVFGAVANAKLRGDHAAPARLVGAVHNVFVGVFAVAVVIAIAAALFPRGDVREPTE
ncbi:MFS transporter [Asanoa iriomotensis]|uniref:MFS transporter n=1 Tax=Asanoa iriomotensis TaxID=234613 RepID=A0ABQ4BYD4_9ACTN|nr:MFS transporter [Asanoa iriomotensis]GIF55542.1 MFS transporter [Asanoa iriomotensis]